MKTPITPDTDFGCKDAREQLDLVLTFFPRVDAKLSTILAINTAMLASLTASFPDPKALTPVSIAFVILATVLITMSCILIYMGGFPRLKGGASSLIYFREIAKRTESQFISEYDGMTGDEKRRDLLGQVWRNSEILHLKFHRLRLAFISMALALIPWSITLGLFAIAKAHLKLVVGLG